MQHNKDTAAAALKGEFGVRLSGYRCVSCSGIVRLLSVVVLLFFENFFCFGGGGVLGVDFR